MLELTKIKGLYDKEESYEMVSVDTNKVESFKMWNCKGKHGTLITLITGEAFVVDESIPEIVGG